MIEAPDRIQEFLRRLTPSARGNLLLELERLELCGGEIPRTADILAELRAEFRNDGSTQNRSDNPSRYFFAPLEPLLSDAAPALSNSGRMLRRSWAPLVAGMGSERTRARHFLLRWHWQRSGSGLPGN